VKVAITLLKLAEQGKMLLVMLGNEVAAIPKNVSLEHEYWKELVAQQHKTKGYKENVNRDSAHLLILTCGTIYPYLQEVSSSVISRTP